MTSYHSVTALPDKSPCWQCTCFLPAHHVCLSMFVHAERMCPVFPFLQELLQLEDRLGNVTRGAVQNTIERFTFPHKYKKVSLRQSGGGKGGVGRLLEAAGCLQGTQSKAQEPVLRLG